MTIEMTGLESNWFKVVAYYVGSWLTNSNLMT